MSAEQPHTTRIAVYGIMQRENKILMLRRRNTGWMDGKYALPAGHLEKDEKLYEAAVREILEETGIVVDKDDLEFKHVSHRNEEGNYEYIDFYYVVQKWKGSPHIAEPNKADDMQWFSVDKLPGNIVPNVKAAILAIQKGVIISEFG